MNNPLKVIKGNLRDLTDLERSLCQQSRLQHERKEEKATHGKAKQLWTEMDGSSNLVEEVHTAQHMQEAAVDIRAIIVRLMDQ